MSQLDAFIRSQMPDYPDPKKEYGIVTPVKAQEWVDAQEGWTVEKALVRYFANGNEERLVVVSRPVPTTPTTPTTKTEAAAAKVKEAIRGSRKS